MLEADDVVLEPDATALVAVGEALVLEELTRGIGGLTATLMRRAAVSDVEGWGVILWDDFDVVEVDLGLSAPIGLLLTFGAGRGAAFNVFSRVPSRYLSVASRKAVLCDVSVHGCIGNI